MILLIVGVLVAIELLALAWLFYSVGSYKNYWAKAANDNGELTYLALGDSAAQGIGATSPRRGYVGVLAERLLQKTGKSVRVINISKTGATLQDYLTEQAPKVKGVKADVVTIEIGANDIRSFDKEKFTEQFRQVLTSLPDGTYVSNMPLFNSRPGSTNNAQEASDVISKTIADFPKLVFVDLQKLTSDNRSIFGFAPDLFHPNNISYKNWADAFWLQINK